MIKLTLIDILCLQEYFAKRDTDADKMRAANLHERLCKIADSIFDDAAIARMSPIEIFEKLTGEKVPQ